MSHKLEWVKPKPFFAYSGFNWTVFKAEEEKANQLIPMYYGLPKGMFTQFLVKFINWMRKGGTYQELIDLSQECYGEDYPDWLYYELSVINPQEKFNYFSYVNIFIKAVNDAYQSYNIVHSSIDVTTLDKRTLLKQRVLLLHTAIDLFNDQELDDLQKSFSSFV